MSIFGAFRRSRFEDAAHRLYVALVGQARRPAFYLDFGVPDTKEGRFDMIALHAFLVMRRLKRTNGDAALLAQALFDLMFADMDQNLREMGVGDLVVGGKVKKLAKAFYGRVAAYEDGLDRDDETLAAALERNVFRDAAPESRNVAGMIRYIRREAESLDAQEPARLMAGEVLFGAVAP
ncbi:MAG: hypothetical protein A3G18_11565 [Rhodospirillales bacterium RIFCSPLOWO2_12_FULL_58_28]|nr:MAG: hypothetical protein A3H92_10715 [Rhodospirillales bacterium RIFCSPLOWO2_02_FULL_58_16]OHC77818.1 MAG: hypothetical protein A3G18_11565 [Rhodospirillales bacterium RIFCSPLOWO2_12_FULL_58_28]